MQARELIVACNMGETSKMPKEIRKIISEKGIKQRERLRIICKNPIVIHHINGNHFDDRPENRMLLTNSEHALLHILQGDIKPYGGRNKNRENEKKGEENVKK